MQRLNQRYSNKQKSADPAEIKEGRRVVFRIGINKTFVGQVEKVGDGRVTIVTRNGLRSCVGFNRVERVLSS